VVSGPKPRLASVRAVFRPLRRHLGVLMARDCSSPDYDFVVADLGPDLRVVVGPSFRKFFLQLRRATADGAIVWAGLRSRDRLADFLDAFGGEFPDLIAACAGVPDNPADFCDLVRAGPASSGAVQSGADPSSPGYVRVLAIDHNVRLVAAPDGGAFVVQFVPLWRAALPGYECWVDAFASCQLSEVVAFLRQSVRCVSDYSGPIAPGLFAGCSGLPERIRDCPLAALPPVAS